MFSRSEGRFVEFTVALDDEVDRATRVARGFLDELLGGIDIFAIGGNDAVADLPTGSGGR
jgi:hypothetical protein